MTPECQRWLERLGEGSEELAAHAEDCEHCRRILASFQAMSALPPPELSEERSAAIRLGALSELSKQPRARPWWRDALVLMVINVVIAAFGVLVFSRRAMTPEIVVLGALLAAVMLLGPLASTAPGHRWGRMALLAAFPLLALAITFGGSGLASRFGFVKSGVGCVLTETALWIGPAAASIWALSRSAFRFWRAAAAAMGSGAAGLVVMDVHCTAGDPEHLFAFHVLPWALLLLLVAAVRSRIPSRSFAP